MRASVRRRAGRPREERAEKLLRAVVLDSRKRFIALAKAAFPDLSPAPTGDALVARVRDLVAKEKLLSEKCSRIEEDISSLGDDVSRLESMAMTIKALETKKADELLIVESELQIAREDRKRFFHERLTLVTAAFPELSASELLKIEQSVAVERIRCLAYGTARIDPEEVAMVKRLLDSERAQRAAEAERSMAALRELRKELEAARALSVEDAKVIQHFRVVGQDAQKELKRAQARELRAIEILEDIRATLPAAPSKFDVSPLKLDVSPSEPVQRHYVDTDHPERSVSQGTFKIPRSGRCAACSMRVVEDDGQFVGRHLSPGLVPCANSGKLWEEATASSEVMSVKP